MEKRSVPQVVFDSPEALRVAAAAVEESREHLGWIPRRMLDEGNPNHPMYDMKLFGYDTAEFLSRQYR